MDYTGEEALAASMAIIGAVSSKFLFDESIVDEIFCFSFYDPIQVARAGHIRGLKYLKRRGKLAKNSLALALSQGRIEAAEFLVSNGFVVDREAIECAFLYSAKSSNNGAAQFVLKRGAVATLDDFEAAAEHGSVSIIKLFELFGFPIQENMKSRILIAGALHLEVIEFMAKSHMPSLWSALPRAIEGDAMDVIDFISMHDCSYGLFPISIARDALFKNSWLEIIYIFYENNRVNIHDVAEQAILIDDAEIFQELIHIFSFQMNFKKLALRALDEQSVEMFHILLLTKPRQIFSSSEVWDEICVSEIRGQFVREFFYILGRHIKVEELSDKLIYYDLANDLDELTEVCEIDEQEALEKSVLYNSIECFRLLLSSKANSLVVEVAAELGHSELVEHYAAFVGIDETFCELFPEYENLLD